MLLPFVARPLSTRAKILLLSLYPKSLQIARENEKNPHFGATHLAVHHTKTGIFFCLNCVNGVDLLQLVEGVDLHDIAERAGTNMQYSSM